MLEAVLCHSGIEVIGLRTEARTAALRTPIPHHPPGPPAGVIHRDGYRCAIDGGASRAHPLARLYQGVQAPHIY